MVKRAGSYEILHNERMRGGDGVVDVEILLTPAEIYDKGRLFAKMTLMTGSSIGHHVHEGEMEAFYIIGGKAEFSDNGELFTLLPGDVALTTSGEEHSIRSIGDTPLELIATIILK
jgi:mannose-6-phosphate isomerase-like protein (cupin superfamily)